LTAHLEATKPAHCHDWLKAAPMSKQFTLTDREFQFAVRMRFNMLPDDSPMLQLNAFADSLFVTNLITLCAAQ